MGKQENNVLAELTMIKQEGMKLNFIELARKYGKDRHTVRKYCEQGGKFDKERSPKASKYDGFGVLHFLTFLELSFMKQPAPLDAYLLLGLFTYCFVQPSLAAAFPVERVPFMASLTIPSTYLGLRPFIPVPPRQFSGGRD